MEKVLLGAFSPTYGYPNTLATKDREGAPKEH